MRLNRNINKREANGSLLPIPHRASYCVHVKFSVSRQLVGLGISHRDGHCGATDNYEVILRLHCWRGL